MNILSDNVPEPTTSLPRALTIAGSDSGAGAGIQADLKTFAALGVYGLSALTAITAQNTLGVNAAVAIDPELVVAQIDAVLSDIGANAIKTGMLANGNIISAVATNIQRWHLPLVVDPVMVAKGGASLLAPEAVEALRTQLLPLATVLTPNIPEAEVLTGRSIQGLDEMEAAARDLYAMGPQFIVVKGGHSAGQPVDIFFDGETILHLVAERVNTLHTHGTGCTFSAAITAFLARGSSVLNAVQDAKTYITGAIQHAPGLGHGHGPIGHFWAWDKQQ
jgi:hydroxymethylpyrimidine/phosphomethylpyrimidine kinase